MKRRWLTLLTFLLLALNLLSGCGGHHQPYKTAPAPPLPQGTTLPSCDSGTNHRMGQCLPKSGPSTKFGVVRLGAQRCVDTSNNDPITTLSRWQAVRRAGFVCAIFKVNEGTGFVDGFAHLQASLARQAGFVVGGYDFLHVCTANATSEAQLFVRLLIADGLTGRNALPGVGDTEYPSSTSCNTHVWLTVWHTTADRLLHRNTGTYTGAWWWNPHVGCWWIGSFSWISGYVSSSGSVPRPCSHGQLDLWQYTDRGVGGDNSVWLNTVLYKALSNSGPPPPPPDPYHYRVLTHHELLVVREYDAARKAPKTHVSELRALHPQLVALAHAIWVAHQHNHKPWSFRNEGERFQVVWPRALDQLVVRG